MEKFHPILLYATMGAVFALCAHPTNTSAQSGNPDRPVISGTFANPASAKAKEERLEQIEALSLTAEQLRQLEAMAKELPEPMQEWAETRADALARQPRYAADSAAIEKEITAAFPQAAQQQKIKIHMILMQLVMGDVADQLQDVSLQLHRDDQQFSRQIVQKLDKLREARTTVIRNFARTRPPRAYAGNDPQQAARAQDRSSRYTQYVQMTTQQMNELQNTERELMDALQTMHRTMNQFWEIYASFRDQEFRTNERIMTTR